MMWFGNHQRISGRDETPMEIPQQEIAQAVESVEEAAAIPVEDDDIPMEDEPQPEVDQDGDAPMNERDDEDTREVAEPEMELDVDDNEGDDPEDASSRIPRGPGSCTCEIELASTYLGIDEANIVDSSGGYARYMAFIIIIYTHAHTFTRAGRGTHDGWKFHKQQCRRCSMHTKDTVLLAIGDLIYHNSVKQLAFPEM